MWHNTVDVLAAYSNASPCAFPYSWWGPYLNLFSIMFLLCSKSSFWLTRIPLTSPSVVASNISDDSGSRKSIEFESSTDPGSLWERPSCILIQTGSWTVSSGLATPPYNIAFKFFEWSPLSDVRPHDRAVFESARAHYRVNAELMRFCQ